MALHGQIPSVRDGVPRCSLGVGGMLCTVAFRLLWLVRHAVFRDAVHEGELPVR